MADELKADVLPVVAIAAARPGRRPRSQPSGEPDPFIDVLLDEVFING
jgi:hypothetical protein